MSSPQRRPASPRILDSPSSNDSGSGYIPPAYRLNLLQGLPHNVNNTPSELSPNFDQPSAFPVLRLHMTPEVNSPMVSEDDSSTLPPHSEDSGGNTIPTPHLTAQREEGSSSLHNRPTTMHFPPIIMEESSSSLPSLPLPTGLNEGSSSVPATNSLADFSAVSKDTGRRSVSPSDEPPAKVRKLSNSSDEGDGETCPVCLEPWGNAGDHRLVALKCGHLFGSKCVERWLKASRARQRGCPTCKAKASLKDMRFIYARRLVAVDAGELTALQQKLTHLQAEKNRVDLELHQSRLVHRSCLERIEALQSSLQPQQQAAPAQPPRRTWRFALEKNQPISREGGCRVLAYNSRSYELYVSQKSESGALFPGYGVRKVSCVDYKCGQFQWLHSKPIRDAAYSPTRDMLLTVGLDSCAKFSSRGSTALSIATGSPLWACAWDALREYEVYTGGVGGTVLQYDIRNPQLPCARLATPGQTTPVVALQSTPLGLLSCRLNACVLWSPRGGAWTDQSLPVAGPFMSMTYEAQSQRALLSCRPRGGEPGRLVVCRLHSDGTCIKEQSFEHTLRSAVMCRAAWVTAGDTCWAAAYAESDAALRLHEVTGASQPALDVLSASLPSSEPALDVLSANISGETILAALSECRLRLYKAVPIKRAL